MDLSQVDFTAPVGFTYTPDIAVLLKPYLQMVVVEPLELEPVLKELRVYYGDYVSLCIFVDYVVDDIKKLHEIENQYKVKIFTSSPQRSLVEEYKGNPAKLEFLVNNIFDIHEQYSLDYRNFKGDYQVLVKNLLTHHNLIYDVHSDNTYEYNGKYWTLITEMQLSKYVVEFWNPKDAFDTRNTERVKQTIKMLRMTKGAKKIDWKSIGLTSIPFENGILDLVTGELEPHNPDFFLETVLPYEWTQELQTCEVWTKMLKEVFWNDQAQIAVLQEFMGYILLPHSKLKKALLMYGDTGTGKSTIQDVMAEMVGRHNVCSLAINEMSSPRKREIILGKLLNLSDEFERKENFKEKGFKQLVNSNTTIPINPKFKPPFNYTPMLKHVFATNHLPDAKFMSDAVMARLVMIRLKCQIQEKDPFIMEKLKAELAGILTWAIEGAKRLIENGYHFTEIDKRWVQKDLLEESDLQFFIENHCQRGDGMSMPLGDFITDLRFFLPVYEKVSTAEIKQELSGLGFTQKKINVKEYGKTSNKFFIFGVKSKKYNGVSPKLKVQDAVTD